MNKEELKKEIDRLTYTRLTLYDRDRLKEMVDQLELEREEDRSYSARNVLETGLAQMAIKKARRCN